MSLFHQLSKGKPKDNSQPAGSGVIEELPEYPDFGFGIIVRRCFEILHRQVEENIPEQGLFSTSPYFAYFNWPDNVCQGRILVSRTDAKEDSICVQAGSNRADSDRLFSNFLFTGTKQEVLQWMTERHIREVQESLVAMWKKARDYDD